MVRREHLLRPPSALPAAAALVDAVVAQRRRQQRARRADARVAERGADGVGAKAQPRDKVVRRRAARVVGLVENLPEPASDARVRAHVVTHARVQRAPQIPRVAPALPAARRDRQHARPHLQHEEHREPVALGGAQNALVVRRKDRRRRVELRLRFAQRGAPPGERARGRHAPSSSLLAGRQPRHAREQPDGAHAREAQPLQVAAALGEVVGSDAEQEAGAGGLRCWTEHRGRSLQSRNREIARGVNAEV